MSALPVVIRELRAEARNAMNPGLRLLAVAIVSGVAAFLLVGVNRLESGAELFPRLHTTVFVLIWFVVPVMAADCIARERRDGTLGLLFLTPLTSRGILIGKGLVHLLRALTILLAAAPVLTLPLLMGGVSGLDVTTAVILEINAVVLALAAALIASALTEKAPRAVLLSLSIAAGFLAAFAISFVGVLLLALLPEIGEAPMSFKEWLELLILGSAFILSGVEGAWNEIADDLPDSGIGMWWVILALISAVALFIASLSLRFAAVRINRDRHEREISRKQQWLIKTFCTPQFLKSLFRRRMKWALNHNPVGWLQQRTWSARISKWGWCLLLVVIYSAALAAQVSFDDFETMQFWLAWLLVGGLAFSACGSFRQERLSGALELLLVTPLREVQILFGRLRALWAQVMPAGILLVFVSLSVGTAAWRSDLDWLWLWAFVSTLFVVPIVGLYFSLRLRNQILAWLLTCLSVAVLPLVLPSMVARMAFGRLASAFRSDVFAFGIIAQIAIALLFAFLLVRNLKQRAFVLSPG